MTIIIYIAILAVIAYIDYKKMIIPDWIVYPAAIGAVLAAISTGDIWWALLWGAINFFLMFGIVVLIGGNMGGGDVKLGALIGIMIASNLALVAVAGAFVAGACYALYLKKINSHKKFIPFGPYLALSAIIFLVLGGI